MKGPPHLPERLRAEAGRAGRRGIARLSPSGGAAWMIRLGEASPDPDSFFALAGFLISAGTAMENAYWRAGSKLRDLMYGLDRALREGSNPGEAASSLGPYGEWLGAELGAGTPRADELRRLARGWAATALERFTLNSYHHPAIRGRQAEALAGAPLRWAAGGPSGFPEGVPSGGGSAAPEMLLRFWDLLNAEREAALGRDRITPAAGRMGGFFGLAGELSRPAPEALQSALAAWRADLAAFTARSDPDASGFAGRALAELDGPAAERERTGRWPADWLLEDPAARARAKPGFWRRMLGRMPE